MKLTSPRARLRYVPCIAGLAWVLASPPAVAREHGIQARGCGGCHVSRSSATVTLMADRDVVMPGDTVTFQAIITAQSVRVGGLYVAAPDTGELGAPDGSGLTLSDGALTHTSPKAAVDGSVTFEFTWKAPAEPGGALLEAFALAANGNGQNTGDAPGQTSIQFAYGCEPTTLYFDADGDGYGNAEYGDRIGCPSNPPMYYVANGDDCDDAHDTVHPGAPERCNGKDDDCDGAIDEDTTPETLYADPDGDGFYAPGTTDTIVGCLPLDGYADEPGDCAPNDPNRHPGAEEVCNLLDDNCDGFVDEFVRPRCGVGRCERESPTCDAAACVPGAPMQERCNGLDDDCNGSVDDGDPCDAGLQCLGLTCVALDGAGGGGGAGATTATGGSSSASGGAQGTPGGGTGDSTGGGSPAAGASSGAGGAPSTTSGGSANAPAESVSLRPGTKAGCALAPGTGRSSGLAAFGLALATLVRRRRHRAAPEQTPPRAA